MLLSFAIDEIEGGRFKLSVVSVCGPQPIGPRLVKHEPEKSPELDDTFESRAAAEKRQAEWLDYYARAGKKVSVKRSGR